MPIERVFLGWDAPCLPRAAAWLRERYAAADGWDMSSALVVVPGGRAARRLLERLVQAAGDTLLIPPEIITPGDLPERLYIPTKPVADHLQALLARVHALRYADQDVLRRVVPQLPHFDDVTGWLALARDLERVYEDLAAEAVPTAEVPRRCADVDDFADESRWEAFHLLEQAFERVLREHGLQSCHQARFEALRKKRCATDRDVVLIGTADMRFITRLMLEQADGGITALIHAPASEADAFDPLGCLITDAWADRRVEIDRSIIHVVDRPRDQAREVLSGTLSLLGRGQGEGQASEKDAVTVAQTDGDKTHASDPHPNPLPKRERGSEPLPLTSISIGIGDDTLGAVIERTLDIADIPARPAFGRSLLQCRPSMLLYGLARYLKRQRFDDLAALLRHCDVEEYLLRTVKSPGDADEAHLPGAGVADWLTLLDRYLTDHLQGRLAQTWLGEPDRATRLKAVYDAVRSLAPDDFQRTRPLPAWSEPIAAALRRVYDGDAFDRADPDQEQLVVVMERLAEALSEQAALDPDDAMTPKVSFADAVLFTLSRLGSEPVVPPEKPGSVELMRWLELQMDDAPALIIAGVNEGNIPESQNGDAFLPDRVRRVLGLADNRRRYARDLFMLTAILHSKERVLLVAGRRSAEEDPLAPSRLLLACDEDELPRRVLQFYGGATEDAPPRPSLLPHGQRSGFAVPRPRRTTKPVTALRVTAFRDYLVCPYRFYLRHVLGLESVDDGAVELDGAAFGRLAHEVMQRFGKSELADATDPEAIAAYLSHALDRVAQQQFGDEPPAAVVIQIAQLRQRLWALAKWQAEQAAVGWRVVKQNVESDLNTTLDVDGEPFGIKGRIDRIDYHERHGYRILDYKTADSAQSPDGAHRDGSGEWIDFQLPLYAALARQQYKLAGPIAFGYVQLPKDLRKVGFAAAEWTQEEIEEAIEVVRGIIRKVRAGEFWPPSAPPPYTDEFGRVCMDACLDRKEAIARGSSPSPSESASGAGEGGESSSRVRGLADSLAPRSRKLDSANPHAPSPALEDSGTLSRALEDSLGEGPVQ